MTLWDYRCRLCAKVVEDSVADITNEPCPTGVCEGVMKRIWAFYLAPVSGGGGSPGRTVRGD